MAEIGEVLNSLNDRLCALEGKSVAFEKLITYQMIMFLAESEQFRMAWDKGLEASIKSFREIMEGSDKPTATLLGAAIDTLDRFRSIDLSDPNPAFPFTVIKGGVED
ncbi:hypothetical protein [Ochrobactrum sp. AN78]|uniref:hypothetical protein n=1 Tax=Ochrobactrum sp. AN78 TaxID=3039853 RepID=UPI002989A57E|nr:hypothetical protein [Ochrobactrum sp. AN78]MDH7793219.1 hypothetical protein [Ochrobactrum sp. AN78]